MNLSESLDLSKKHKIRILGAVDYDTALSLQLEERKKVKEGQSSGTIFFLEHVPAVITLGRNAKDSNVLFPKDLLESKGYHIREVSRGGDVTVHEPGQLVVYFVMPLKSKAVKNFVNGVVGTIQQFLEAEYNIKTSFDPKKPGLWVADKKICSIGFDLTERVSMHGIALNFCNDLSGFKMINPCGLGAVKLTSVAMELESLDAVALGSLSTAMQVLAGYFS
jgi:lipoyl(octanoyl) transferase